MSTLPELSALCAAANERLHRAESGLQQAEDYMQDLQMQHRQRQGLYIVEFQQWPLSAQK